MKINFYSQKLINNYGRVNSSSVKLPHSGRDSVSFGASENTQELNNLSFENQYQKMEKEFEELIFSKINLEKTIDEGTGVGDENLRIQLRDVNKKLENYGTKDAIFGIVLLAQELMEHKKKIEELKAEKRNIVANKKIKTDSMHKVVSASLYEAQSIGTSRKMSEINFQLKISNLQQQQLENEYAEAKLGLIYSLMPENKAGETYYVKRKASIQQKNEALNDAFEVMHYERDRQLIRSTYLLSQKETEMRLKGLFGNKDSLNTVINARKKFSEHFYEKVWHLQDLKNRYEAEIESESNPEKKQILQRKLERVSKKYSIYDKTLLSLHNSAVKQQDLVNFYMEIKEFTKEKDVLEKKEEKTPAEEIRLEDLGFKIKIFQCVFESIKSENRLIEFNLKAAVAKDVAKQHKYQAAAAKESERLKKLQAIHINLMNEYLDNLELYSRDNKANFNSIAKHNYIACTINDYLLEKAVQLAEQGELLDADKTHSEYAEKQKKYQTMEDEYFELDKLAIQYNQLLRKRERYYDVSDKLQEQLIKLRYRTLLGENTQIRAAKYISKFENIYQKQILAQVYADKLLQSFGLLMAKDNGAKQGHMQACDKLDSLLKQLKQNNDEKKLANDTPVQKPEQIPFLDRFKAVMDEKAYKKLIATPENAKFIEDSIRLFDKRITSEDGGYYWGISLNTDKCDDIDLVAAFRCLGKLSTKGVKMIVDLDGRNPVEEMAVSYFNSLPENADKNIEYRFMEVPNDIAELKTTNETEYNEYVAAFLSMAMLEKNHPIYVHCGHAWIKSKYMKNLYTEQLNKTGLWK